MRLTIFRSSYNILVIVYDHLCAALRQRGGEGGGVPRRHGGATAEAGGDGGDPGGGDGGVAIPLAAEEEEGCRDDSAALRLKLAAMAAILVAGMVGVAIPLVAGGSGGAS
uniref:Uncharacterized protein n=1 Tax=Ananas comosus var. bracteatus TaxID=296719 RepID=A0A6V7P8W2_ANACO|nr:unnamed protein product [Ananas comosus var. bracteatus]